MLSVKSARDAALPTARRCRAREGTSARGRAEEEVREKGKEEKRGNGCRAVLDGTIGYSRGRTAGGGPARNRCYRKERTAKERVHMYAGDVGT